MQVVCKRPCDPTTLTFPPLRNFGCVRLTDASAAGVSSAERKQGSHHFHREPRAGHREVSGEASVAACAGRAIKPDIPGRMCRDCPNDRRQHFLAALGWAKEGIPGSKNPGTHGSTSSGPERSSDRPAIERGLWRHIAGEYARHRTSERG